MNSQELRTTTKLAGSICRDLALLSKQLPTLPSPDSHLLSELASRELGSLVSSASEHLVRAHSWLCAIEGHRQSQIGETESQNGQPSPTDFTVQSPRDEGAKLREVARSIECDARSMIESLDRLGEHVDLSTYSVRVDGQSLLERLQVIRFNLSNQQKSVESYLEFQPEIAPPESARAGSCPGE